MPPLEYADLAWTNILVSGPDGAVKKRDVVNALAAQYPFEHASVERELPWARWEHDDRPGCLDAEKLCHPHTGLKATVLVRNVAEPGTWKWTNIFKRAVATGPPAVVAD